MHHSTVSPFVPWRGEEGRAQKKKKSVLFQVKTTKSFNCVMTKKKSEQKGGVVSELIRQGRTVNCARVLCRDWRLSGATVLTAAPTVSAIIARACKTVTSQQTLSVISHYAEWSCLDTRAKWHHQLFSNHKEMMCTFNILVWNQRRWKRHSVGREKTLPVVRS